MKNITLMVLASLYSFNVAIACDEHMQPGKDTVLKETTATSGVACSPYEYTSTKDASQSLGSLRDGTDVSSEISKLKAKKPKVKKVVKKEPKPIEIKQEEIPASTGVEVKIEDNAVVITPQVEEKQVVAPKPEVKTEAKPEKPSQPAVESTQRLSRLEFTKDATELDAAHKITLTSIANDMKASAGLSIKVNSYAFAQGAELSEARRIALQRAIKIRKTLIENDIAPTRISVSTFEQEGAGTDYVELNLSGM